MSRSPVGECGGVGDRLTVENRDCVGDRLIFNSWFAFFVEVKIRL